MTAMFLSSCYWPPVPLETSLSTPWSSNITTFSDALLSIVPDVPPELMPTEIPIVEHCWCDITSGKFFEPFNFTQWEVNSVQRLKEEVVRRIRERGKIATSGRSTDGAIGLRESEKQEHSAMSRLTSMWGTVWQFTRTPQPEPSTNASSTISTNGRDGQRENLNSSSTSPILLPRPSFFRKEYDLRPYGFGMVVDFGWASDTQ